MTTAKVIKKITVPQHALQFNSAQMQAGSQDLLLLLFDLKSDTNLIVLLST
jgi:hypothetical protein